ncbi:GntR family transcriptional repressor for pyruvate dehydrogenase complex [Catenulispora sp. GP43]|uniref:FadR/GntR family transcriptional regulator n=1 Tax=Catenulispora sp. GP43 TaxID=3156263 RepID=UPI0035177E86
MTAEPEARTAVDRAFTGIRRMIADGRLGPGARLPLEGELCEELEVSRGSLREAVRMLAALHIVEPRHGSGTYVSSLEPAEIIGSLSLTVELLPPAGLLELYEIRRVLESYVAGQAAARLSREAERKLFGLIEAMEAIEEPFTPEALELHYRLDFEFHSVIAQTGGNTALESLLAVFRGRARAYQVFELPEGPAIKHRSDEEHRAIATALADRDPAAAAHHAAEHVAHTERWLRILVDPARRQG